MALLKPVFLPLSEVAKELNIPVTYLLAEGVADRIQIAVKVPKNDDGENWSGIQGDVEFTYDENGKRTDYIKIPQHDYIFDSHLQLSANILSVIQEEGKVKFQELHHEDGTYFELRLDKNNLLPWISVLNLFVSRADRNALFEEAYSQGYSHSSSIKNKGTEKKFTIRTKRAHLRIINGLAKYYSVVEGEPFKDWAERLEKVGVVNSDPKIQFTCIWMLIRPRRLAAFARPGSSARHGFMPRPC